MRNQQSICFGTDKRITLHVNGNQCFYELEDLDDEERIILSPDEVAFLVEKFMEGESQ